MIGRSAPARRDLIAEKRHLAAQFVACARTDRSSLFTKKLRAAQYREMNQSIIALPQIVWTALE
jgi:hypothetical protein